MRFFKPQVDYMKSYYPGFKKAQAAGSAPVAGGDTALEVFWKGIKGHFLREWPTPQAEQAAALEALAAHNAANPKQKKKLPKSLAAERPSLSPEELAKWKTEREDAVVRWFYNHDSTVKDSAPELKIELATPREIGARALTKPQLYSKKYYTKRVLKNVDDAIAKMEAPPKRKEMMAIISKVTADTFASESPEILAEIDQLEAEAAAERQRMKDVLKNAFVDDFSERVQVDEPSDVYCRHISTLDTIFQGLLPVLSKKTGWSFSVICGGPDPMKPNGEIRTRSYHEGRTPEGLSFSKVLPTYENTYVHPYSAFLHMVYPPDVRQSRVMKSGLATLLDVMNRPTGEEALAAEDAPSVPKAVPDNEASTSGPPPAASVSPTCAPPQGGVGAPPTLMVAQPSASMSANGDTRGSSSLSQMSPASAASAVSTSMGAPFLSGAEAPAPICGGAFDDLGRLMDETQRVLENRGGVDGPGPAAIHLALGLRPDTGSLASELDKMGAGDYGDLARYDDQRWTELDGAPHAYQSTYMLPSFPPSFGPIPASSHPPSFSQLHSAATITYHNGLQMPIVPPQPPQLQVPTPAAQPPVQPPAPQPPQLQVPTPAAQPPVQPPAPQPPQLQVPTPVAQPPVQPPSTQPPQLQVPTPVAQPPVQPPSTQPPQLQVPTPAAQPPVQPPAPQPPQLQVPTPVAQPPVQPPAPQPPAPHVTMPAAQPPVQPPPAQPPVPSQVPQPVGKTPASRVPTPAEQPPAPSISLGLKRTAGEIEPGQRREKRPRRAAIGLEGEWVTGVSESLKMRVEDPRWNACVGDWVNFELARVVTTGRFPVTKARPVEIAKWVAKGGDHDKAPQIEDIDEFGARWCSWWNEVQPDWRKNENGTLPHHFDPSTTSQSLATLEKAGPKGIGMALQSLSWWAGGKDTSLWFAAVDDIHRCLRLFNKNR